jgi:hypothetical protein
MRSRHRLFPRVTVRRVWNLDGTPGWEFRFASRPSPALAIEAGPAPTATPTPDRRNPVRFVSSRGVQIGADTLEIDQFHHRVRKSAADSGERFADLLESPDDVAATLVELAAAPGDEAAQQRVITRLAHVHPWLRSVPVLDISAARIAGAGLGRSLDGVFVWRAEGGRHLTYLVAPDSGTRELLAADPDLVRALIRAACPDPDDALGELESNLREALTRIGVVDPATVRAVGPTPAARLVLRVDPGADLIDKSGATDGSAAREKSESERALSEELAELARKVGTASVRKPAPGRALEAG